MSVKWLLVLYFLNSSFLAEGGLYLHKQECSEAGAAAVIDGFGSEDTGIGVSGWTCVPVHRK